jgi:hypothetical protein
MSDGNNNAVIQRDNGSLSLNQVVQRVNLVHQILDKVMVKGTHYGTVPGCGDKLVLLKPGADVLAMTFRLVPEFDITTTDLPDGHKEYTVKCFMRNAAGDLVAQGVGAGSTMEKKYRYRKDRQGNQQENTDIADVYNTVLKMTKKRAHVDATLTATGAADIFTQDLIDEDDPAPARKAKPAAPKPTERPPAHTQDDAPPPAHDNQEPGFGAGLPVVTGRIEVISEKPTKNGTMRWGVKVDGQFYGTFDRKLADIAKAADADGVNVEIEYSTDAKGFHNIVTIKAV